MPKKLGYTVAEENIDPPRFTSNNTSLESPDVYLFQSDFSEVILAGILMGNNLSLESPNIRLLEFEMKPCVASWEKLHIPTYMEMVIFN